MEATDWGLDARCSGREVVVAGARKCAARIGGPSAPKALERHREEAITERERALTGVDDDPGS